MTWYFMLVTFIKFMLFSMFLISPATIFLSSSALTEFSIFFSSENTREFLGVFFCLFVGVFLVFFGFFFL